MRLTFWSSSSVVFLLVASLAGPTPATGQRLPPVGFWSMFRQNPEHSGQVPAFGPLLPALDWRLELGGPSYSSAAIDQDGSVYVGSDGRVLAINTDGKLLWSRVIGGNAISSPAMDDAGRLFIGCRDNIVYALDIRTGDILWRFVTGDEVWASPTIGPGGTVYVGSFDGNLYAIDPASGAEYWHVETGGEISSSAAVGPNNIVYVGSSDGSLYAVGPDGGVLWEQTVADGAEIGSSPALLRDRVYVGSLGGTVEAFDAFTGEHVWGFETGGAVASSPAVSNDGTIFVGSDDGYLYAITSDGTLRWRFATTDRVISSPALDSDGVVYIGSFDGRLYAVTSDGTLRWSYQADHPVWSSPSLNAEGAVVFSDAGTETQPGNLYRIGAARFSVTFPTPPTSGVATTAVVSRPIDFGTPTGSLYYRRGGESVYEEVAIPITQANEFFVSIPAEAVTIRGLEYYVSLTDGFSTVTMPVSDPAGQPGRVQVHADSVETSVGLQPRSYRIVSAPFELDDPSIAGVLADDYGPYDRLRWRLFGLSEGGYQEYPDLSTGFLPGKAFMLVTRDGTRFDFGSASSASTSTPVAIHLTPGWNLVGNPYAFPIDFGSFGGEIESVSERAYFDGTEMLQEEQSVRVLMPWEGLLMRNASEDPITLLAYPIEAILVDEDATDEVDRSTEPYEIRLKLLADDGRRVDTQNWIGFDDGQAPDDLIEAPSPATGARLSILEDGERWARRFKRAAGATTQWTLEVSVAAASDKMNDSFTLEVDARLPAGYTLRLVDAETGNVIPLEQNRATLRVNEATRRFTLIAGVVDAVEAVAPVSGKLTVEPNYPNPFDRETVVAVKLPREGHLRIEIYDVLGRLVRTLFDDTREAGRHTFSWDGKGASAHELPSGIYIIRAHAGSTTVTRSITLVR